MLIGSIKTPSKSREGLRELSAPFALDTGTHNITLSWEPLNQSNVTYIPQWTGPSLSGTWMFKENTTAPPCTVDALQPYSWYMFRVLAMLEDCQQLIASPESQLYQTEAYGAPPSPPVIDMAESLSSDSVELGWSAPLYTGGPVLGYNINLTSHHGNPGIIALTTGPDVFSATVFPTASNTTYRVSIAVVNIEGQGPAAEATVSTPERHELSGTHWIIASRMKSLRTKRANSIYSPATCLSDPRIASNITGVSVLSAAGRVYFSEGANIWTKTAGDDLSDPSDLRLLHSAALEVTALSVDWLYHKLYFISGGKVYRCSLEGCSDSAHVQIPTPAPPIRIKADPYNGWLFLLLHDGIHRVVLPDDASPDHAHNQNNTLVVKSSSLHDFAVSVRDRKLVFFHFLPEGGTLSLAAVSLDGSSPVTLHADITVVEQVRSMAYEDNRVVFTDGENVYQEVSEGEVTRFNEYLMDCVFSEPALGGFDNLLYNSSRSQPHPVPRTPRDLNVLFGATTANVMWRAPPLTAGASPSAWHNWTYIVTASLNGSVVRTYRGITGTQVTVTGLLSGWCYTLSVKATSPGGESSPVQMEGTTLWNESAAPYIIAASSNRLWRQELDAYDFTRLLVGDVTAVRDMDWYNDTVFWADSAGRVHYVALVDEDVMSRPNIAVLLGLEDVEVLAFDWLGRQLYWNCNRTQICRVHLNSGQQDVVWRGGRGLTGGMRYIARGRHGFTRRKHDITGGRSDSTGGGSDITGLVLDPLDAWVYWSTAWSVERARLNGQQHLIIQQLSVLSGRQVAGLTIDLAEGSLFWLVQDGATLDLYRADVITNNVVLLSARWSVSEVWGYQLGVFGGRLLWLDEERRLKIQETNSTHSSLMTPQHTLSAFTLIDNTLKPLPEGFLLPPVVTPQPVSAASVRVHGNASVFQVTWEGDSHVNYGSVLYCVQSDARPPRDRDQAEQSYTDAACPPSQTLPEPVLVVRQFQPNTPFQLSITPFTYWGKADTTSVMLRSPAVGPSTESDAIVIVFGVLTGALLALIITAVFIWFRRRTGKESDLPTPLSETPAPQGQDKELEQIRGLVGMATACYAIRALPVPSEIDTLPVFPREQLRLQRLLGSGAFGEVYEGIASGMAYEELKSDTRVAVKTLKKGATDDEKSDFLKEAHLMSQFAHPNILRLVGVCLLNEPQYLILELMEGGDLRSYLMEARPSPDHGPLLNLGDLLDICLDVAKGCAYLEKMHFVHRDLAARNCLVSVKDYTAPGRVVKIGDFGLSRDVYKNDYYRKRGEGLLPVRWMSPESLTDGVFNKHSDVWSFGVLLWEVFSLGRQPYPALTNMEVVHHINSGGRLPPPPDCPGSLYEVMLACWLRAPKERPSFRRLESQLVRLRETEVEVERKLREELQGSRGEVNLAFQGDEDEMSCAVDQDESPDVGLTHVLSEEGLNYLMFSADGGDKETRDAGEKEPDAAQQSDGETATDHQLSCSSNETLNYLMFSADAGDKETDAAQQSDGETTDYWRPKESVQQSDREITGHQLPWSNSEEALNYLTFSTDRDTEPDAAQQL
ncbi:proto-oncogene tyrosine-protein kinase ROS [Engraulis encrasicolus]|uniref:proto-oncogene tyrosine-protein kinase ROS n=1 Tax=Engraulis encrasicolus TaxID=184585 RepID=UPI002FCFC433